MAKRLYSEVLTFLSATPSAEVAIAIPAPVYNKAEWLEEQLETQLDDELDVACMRKDLLRHAFNQIDWVGLVRSNLE